MDILWDHSWLTWFTGILWSSESQEPPRPQTIPSVWPCDRPRGNQRMDNTRNHQPGSEIWWYAAGFPFIAVLATKNHHEPLLESFSKNTSVQNHWVYWMYIGYNNPHFQWDPPLKSHHHHLWRLGWQLKGHLQIILAIDGHQPGRLCHRHKAMWLEMDHQRRLKLVLKVERRWEDLRNFFEAVEERKFKQIWAAIGQESRVLCEAQRRNRVVVKATSIGKCFYVNCVARMETANQRTAKVRDLSTQLWIPRNCTVLNQSQINAKSEWRWSCSICFGSIGQKWQQGKPKSHLNSLKQHMII